MQPLRGAFPNAGPLPASQVARPRGREGTAACPGPRCRLPCWHDSSPSLCSACHGSALPGPASAPCPTNRPWPSSPRATAVPTLLPRSGPPKSDLHPTPAPSDPRQALRADPLPEQAPPASATWGSPAHEGVERAARGPAVVLVGVLACTRMNVVSWSLGEKQASNSHPKEPRT